MTNEEEQYFRDMLSLVCAGCVHCWDAEKCKECLFSKLSERAIEALKERPHGECKTCNHFVKGGLDGKTYVCEHPYIELDDQYDYACLTMGENDFCSCYEKRKEGDVE